MGIGQLNFFNSIKLKKKDQPLQVYIIYYGKMILMSLLIDLRLFFVYDKSGYKKVTSHIRSLFLDQLNQSTQSSQFHF